MVELSTADREVPGSNPGVPFSYVLFFLETNHIINLTVTEKKKKFLRGFFLVLCRNNEFLTWLRYRVVDVVRFTE